MSGYQCGKHALAFFLDVLGKTGILLLDERGGQPELEQSYRQCRAEIVEIRTDFRQLQRLYGFVHQLFQC